MKRYRGDCRVIGANTLVKLRKREKTLVSWSNVGYPADGCYYCCHNSVCLFQFGLIGLVPVVGHAVVYNAYNPDDNE